MIKGEIKQEDITLVNIYAPNIGAPIYVKHILMYIKGEIDRNTVSTSIPLKIRNKTGMSDFTSLIQHSTGSSSYNNQTSRRNKKHPNQKGRNETFFICR